MKLTRLVLCTSSLALALNAQTPAQVRQVPPSSGPRMMSMLFDLNSMDAAMQSRALENAVKFIQEQATPADLVSVMTYTTKLNVLQDFTDNHDSLLAAIRSIIPGDIADARDPILATDAQLTAIQDAVKQLAAYPERKAMLYFSSGIPRNGIDNQAQLRAVTNAAIRANVSIYSVDSRGLQASPPQ
jgi:VWFA-related protein